MEFRLVSQRPAGYSATQIVLHWAIAILIMFQIVAHDGMEAAWHAFTRGTPLDPGDALLADLHIYAGVLVLVLGLWFVVLRLFRGAPKLPEGEHPLLKFTARATHFLLYMLIVGMPLVGLAGWFSGEANIVEVHSTGRLLLIPLVILHAVGALVQHFWMKSDVLKRMVAARG
jgi:cytochrome b561